VVRTAPPYPLIYCDCPAKGTAQSSAVLEPFLRA
jgi:hypothetical protein